LKSEKQIDEPRLLYVGDVPVESSYHGSALLFRLLQEYDPDKLCIVETNHLRSLRERRLPKVRYRELRLGWNRPLYSRFSGIYASYVIRRAGGFHRQLPALLGDFVPDAVITVSHGFSWRTAAKFASINHLPLHLICHDDLPGVGPAMSFHARWKDFEFGRIYAQATSRLCVSPFMQEEYRERYGVDGQVLYPSRSADCPEFAAPPGRLLGDCPNPTAIYAGSINSKGYADSIRLLSESLEDFGGRLLIFSPLDANDLRRFGLNRPNIRNCGLRPFNELIQFFRDNADFLYVPMSFDPGDRSNMELSFPSKLTDYTAAGVPLLVRGPAYCSAIRWIQANPGIAESVPTDEKADFVGAIARLTQPGAHRYSIAAEALKVGREHFSFSSIHEKFIRAIKEGGKVECV
jgi:glycosyltransferase involved in cell wall biosynthesis